MLAVGLSLWPLLRWGTCPIILKHIPNIIYCYLSESYCKSLGPQSIPQEKKNPHKELLGHSIYVNELLHNGKAYICAFFFHLYGMMWIYRNGFPENLHLSEIWAWFTLNSALSPRNAINPKFMWLLCSKQFPIPLTVLYPTLSKSLSPYNDLWGLSDLPPLTLIFWPSLLTTLLSPLCSSCFTFLLIL